MAVFENQGELFILTTQIVSNEQIKYTEELVSAWIGTTEKHEISWTTTDLLSLFVSNGTKLVQVQELSVKPFVSNLNSNSAAGKNFIAIAGSFHKKF